MTSRRYPFYIAVALLAVHAAVLEWRCDAWPGPILSDTVQLLMGILVFCACLQAMRRSLVFGRLFWKLAGTARHVPFSRYRRGTGRHRLAQAFGFRASGHRFRAHLFLLFHAVDPRHVRVRLSALGGD